MDIEKLTDEVVRRLLERLRQDFPNGWPTQLGAPATGQSAAATKPVKSGARGGKMVITQTEAMAVPANSELSYPKGTIVTPLAKDIFKERGVRVVIG